MVNKALPIVKVLYIDYSFLFLFDNTTNHSMFAQDILYIIQINKKIWEQQP